MLKKIMFGDVATCNSKKKKNSPFFCLSNEFFLMFLTYVVFTMLMILVTFFFNNEVYQSLVYLCRKYNKSSYKIGIVYF